MSAGFDWQSLSENVDARMCALRCYADHVLKDGPAAVRWITTPNLAVRNGLTPAAACRTAQGFFESMADLARIKQISEREEARKSRAVVIPMPLNRPARPVDL